MNIVFAVEEVGVDSQMTQETCATPDYSLLIAIHPFGTPNNEWMQGASLVAVASPIVTLPNGNDLVVTQLLSTDNGEYVTSTDRQCTDDHMEPQIGQV